MPLSVPLKVIFSRGRFSETDQVDIFSDTDHEDGVRGFIDVLHDARQQVEARKRQK